MSGQNTTVRTSAAGARSRRLGSAVRIGVTTTLAGAPRGFLTGIVVALVVILAGMVFGAHRPSEWTATSQWLTGPAAFPRGSEDTSSYYETLSRGQITQTAAAVMGNQQFVDAAKRSLGLEAGSPATVRVTVVPETALVKVTVIATNPNTAERLGNEVPNQAAPAVDRLLQPFALRRVVGASGTAVRTSIGGIQFYAVLGAVALMLGVGAQQLVYQLTVFRGRLRPPSGS
jgi:capsular polysaccharide biosynthesis protein